MLTGYEDMKSGVMPSEYNSSSDSLNLLNEPNAPTTSRIIHVSCYTTGISTRRMFTSRGGRSRGLCGRQGRGICPQPRAISPGEVRSLDWPKRDTRQTCSHARNTAERPD